MKIDLKIHMIYFIYGNQSPTIKSQIKKIVSSFLGNDIDEFNFIKCFYPIYRSFSSFIMVSRWMKCDVFVCEYILRTNWPIVPVKALPFLLYRPYSHTIFAEI